MFERKKSNIIRPDFGKPYKEQPLGVRQIPHIETPPPATEEEIRAHDTRYMQNAPRTIEQILHDAALIKERFEGDAYQDKDTTLSLWDDLEKAAIWQGRVRGMTLEALGAHILDSVEEDWDAHPAYYCAIAREFWERSNELRSYLNQSRSMHDV